MKTVIKLFSILLVLALLGSFIIAVGGTPPDFLKDFINDLGGAWSAFRDVFLVMFFTLVGLLYQVPAIMNQEKDDELARVNQIVVQLEEVAKPKLELKFDDTNATSRYPLADDGTLFRFFVTNIGTKEKIESVVVTLAKIDITPELPILPIRLGITHNYPDQLNAGDHLFADGIQFYPPKAEEGKAECSLRFGWDLGNHISNIPVPFDPSKSLRFSITASGSNTSLVEKTFEFYLEDVNGVELPNVREVAS